MKQYIFLDDGFFFGKGLFETIKVVNRKPILLKEHVERINNSLKAFNISQKVEESEVLDFIMDHEEDSYALKLSVSDQNKIITTRHDPYVTGIGEEVKLNFASTLRNSTSFLVYHKTFNYMDNILEKRNSKENGFFEPIFFNEKGYITEGAVSNIFFIKKGKIFTPKISCGLLNGVMRDFFIKSFPVSEVLISKEDLQGFDSCFITNSLMGYVKVDSLGEFKFKEASIFEEFDKNLKLIGFFC
ncbi:aminotransferase class IV [Lagierella sp.]|uniref:aminotransferase class IV n=1 Tax=Lagierella sp. TaxID=2849657 RepID=UPI002621F6C7|nr:aminotransferase class IV [Lagierella sp.]